MYRLARSLPFQLRERLHFWRGMLKNPGRVGAVAPSGRQLARAMAAHIAPDGALPVLELGPGTGSITAAILERITDPSQLVLVEFDAGFRDRLTVRFPAVTVLQGDAFDLEQTLGAKAPRLYRAIVSGLPLLNFPVPLREKLLRDCFSHLGEGGVFIQFSYGRKAPVRPDGALCEVITGGWLARNVPPARVHVYRRSAPASGADAR